MVDQSDLSKTDRVILLASEIQLDVERLNVQLQTGKCKQCGGVTVYDESLCCDDEALRNCHDCVAYRCTCPPWAVAER